MFVKVAALALSVVFFSATCETKTPVRSCPNNHPLPLNVQINDCETSPCVVTRGTIASMDVQFVATKDDTYHIATEVRATVLGIVIPYPLPNDSANVCKNLLYGAYCPLYASEDVTYHIDFPMDSNIPEVNVKCEVKLYDKDRDVVTCFIADLKVRRPTGDSDFQ